MADFLTGAGLFRPRVQTLPIISLLSNTATEITVETPALVRINGIHGAGASGFQDEPPANETTNLFMNATPRGNPVDVVNRLRQAVRSTGPLLYLPGAGSWLVYIADSNAAPPFQTCEVSIFEGLAPEIIHGVLAGEYPARYASGQLLVAAGANRPLISASFLTPNEIHQYFSCTSLRFTNNGPVGTVFTAIGRIPTILAGHPINVPVTQVREWKDLAGRSVHVFNPTAADVELYVEATFL